MDKGTRYSRNAEREVRVLKVRNEMLAMYIYVHLWYTHTYIHMYTYTYTHMYTYTYIHMYTHIYIYVYILPIYMVFNIICGVVIDFGKAFATRSRQCRGGDPSSFL